jgi:hypothetical protein
MTMIRTFNHLFDPIAASPVTGQFAELTVEEIEDAGIREVLQTPGAALGSWAILDSLLEPLGAGSPFIFKEPLGQAREVKVALSGLFGRFVARAYLGRYFGLSFFAHLGQRQVVLDGKLGVQVKRKPQNADGDLPDWIACDAGLVKLTVAEAKGCHDTSGPSQALARAWKQANRIDVLVNQRKAPLKRMAIAIRWGSAKGGAPFPIMSVRDPEEEGEMSASEREAALLGVARLHSSNLLKALGHLELAGALAELTSGIGAIEEGTVAGAELAIRRARGYRILSDHLAAESTGELLGNWVTRAGPIARVEPLSPSDQESLRGMELRPVFVGLERQLVMSLVAGDIAAVRHEISRPRHATARARPDRVGCWIVQVGDGTIVQ